MTMELRQVMQRKLQFDFGTFWDPICKESVEVTGQFPVIIPSVEGILVQEDVVRSQKFLKIWTESMFKSDLNPKYVEDTTTTVAIFVPLTYPFQPIGSPKFNLCLQFLMFLWVIDDILESCVSNKLTSEQVYTNGATYLLGILSKNTTDFDKEKVEGFPSFQGLFNAFSDIVQKLQVFDSTGGTKTQQFYFLFKEYFECVARRSKIDGALSEETFRKWRGGTGFFSGSVEFYWIVENEHGLPSEVLESPVLRSIWSVIDSMGASTNDLLGILIDVLHGDKQPEQYEVDNLVVFKIVQKGIRFCDAVDQVCEVVKNDVVEYLKLRENFVQNFSKCSEVMKYIDVIETALYGHCQSYLYMPRYRASGCVKLTD